MNQRKPLHELRVLVDSVRVGLLSTSGTDGYPHTRWMTAAMLPGERSLLYCVSAVGSGKIDDIRSDAKVAWSFQTPALDEVVSVDGRAAVLDNPELKAQVLEALGPDMATFWRVHPEPARLIVIETSVDRVSLFLPMENVRVSQETAV